MVNPKGQMSTPREAEMAEATSSKRHSTGKNNGNLEKKSATQQESNFRINQEVLEFWYGYPAMEAIAKHKGQPTLDYTCVQTNKQCGMAPTNALEFATAKIAYPGVPHKVWPVQRPNN
jgi:hypothetical protein